MNEINDFLKFPVTIFGEMKQFTPTLSKSRCRIFYKYANRNGTYITDEFAEKLVKTLPYTPIKGIYEEEEEDYTDHGNRRDLGRIYGVVPADPNFSWEKHLDEDGKERIYACCDVLLYTAIYKEASEIINKSQSMELYDKSIKGAWKRIDGNRFYVFEDACFLGLQVLGDETEPCFEGAAFYSLYNDFKNILNELQSYSLKDKKEGGTAKMYKILFKMSDSEKHDKIWTLLNPNYTEEGGWIVEYSVLDVYDDYCIVRNYADGSYERVYYAKNEDDSITINKKKKCFIMDVTEEELNILNQIKSLNGDTFDKADEKFSTISALTEENKQLTEDKDNFEQKFLDSEQQLSTLKQEKDELQNSYDLQKKDIDNITQELDGLKQYKLDIEKEQKDAVLTKYSSKLESSIIEEYREKISEYTVDNLERELAYVLVTSNPSVFSQDEGNSGRIPKSNQKSGIEAILDKYKK